MKIETFVKICSYLAIAGCTLMLGYENWKITISIFIISLMTYIIIDLS